MAGEMKLGKAGAACPKPLVAGEFCTIVYNYTAGHSIDEGGCVKIVFRHVADFGIPQFEDPSGENYCSLKSASGKFSIIPRWDNRGHIRPWRKALFMQITGSFMDSGDTLTLVFGDRSGGSPGWRMQTFAEKTFEFKTLVDPMGTFVFKELPESPCLPVVPGKPARAVCIAPSTAALKEPFSYYLKLEDMWGNPTRLPERIPHSGFSSCGYRVLSAVDEPTGLTAESNPLIVQKDHERLNHYWADFHGQSEETIGTNSIEDYFRFGKDYALLDILGHQGNDFQITDSFWRKIKKISREYNITGKFVSFPGYEWSGNTPLGGDRNVFFRGGGSITRSSRELIPGQKSVYPDSPTAEALFTRLNKAGRSGPFVFAHAGGRYAEMKMHEEDLEVAVEIHSAWGTFEWLLEEALQLGHTVGICANSDGHKGRPGAEYPGAGLFGSYGGLTCVLAPSLTRQDIFEAMKRRHFYATTGNRCLINLTVWINGSPAGMMGDIIYYSGGDEIILKAQITGTAAVESVELKEGSKLLRKIRTYSRDDPGRKVKILWGGAESKGRARMADWSGALILSGNRMLDVAPINFWNPAAPVVKKDGRNLAWKSYTSGGVSGFMIDFDRSSSGRIKIKTAQGNAAYELSSPGYDPRVYRFGGLDKEIRIYRLPDKLPDRRTEIEYLVKPGRGRQTPVHLRVNQCDGHSAWTSPVYLRPCKA